MERAPARGAPAGALRAARCRSAYSPLGYRLLELQAEHPDPSGLPRCAGQGWQDLAERGVDLDVGERVATSYASVDDRHRNPRLSSSVHESQPRTSSSARTPARTGRPRCPRARSSAALCAAARFRRPGSMISQSGPPRCRRATIVVEPPSSSARASLTSRVRRKLALWGQAQAGKTWPLVGVLFGAHKRLSSTFVTAAP